MVFFSCKPKSPSIPKASNVIEAGRGTCDGSGGRVAVRPVKFSVLVLPSIAKFVVPKNTPSVVGMNAYWNWQDSFGAKVFPAQF